MRIKTRTKILAFVLAIAVLFLVGTALSLFRISEVSRSLDAVNEVAVPMSRLLAQLKVDADVYKREAERSLGYSHWGDPHWRPRPIPEWISEMISQEEKKVAALIDSRKPWSDPEERARWKGWAEDLETHTAKLEQDSETLFQALSKGGDAEKLYPAWLANLESWYRKIDWATTEFERGLRKSFLSADQQVRDLRSALQILLAVVLSLSLLIVWIGERTLRPLGGLTTLARGIAERGLRKEDKQELPPIPLVGSDEVSELTREFHRMATTLLEREKTVEAQQQRLSEQNQLLSRMSALNRNILSSIRSVILVTDSDGKIQLANPGAVAFLGRTKTESSPTPAGSIIGSSFRDWPILAPFLPFYNALEKTALPQKIAPLASADKVYEGHFLPLGSGPDALLGMVLVLEDRTESIDLEQRLRAAENLAAVGRMSAQVAHEIRNPLHSIGLEAELAITQFEQSGSGSPPSPSVKQALQSILISVDRMQSITENYLKLSRLSSGQKEAIDPMDALQNVLALHAQNCEKNGIAVDWSREESAARARAWMDRVSLEQVLGNLFQNAVQALLEAEVKHPRIECRVGALENGRYWIRIEDNGPGVPPGGVEKIFTPFWTTRAGGTGLGLSFVRKVLEDQGGEIRYERSQRLGGAAFDVLLPGEAPVLAGARKEISERGEHVENTLGG